MLKMANGTRPRRCLFPGLQFARNTATRRGILQACLLCKWTLESETNFINKKYLSTFSRSIHIMVFAYDDFSSDRKVLKGRGRWRKKYGKMST